MRCAYRAIAILWLAAAASAADLSRDSDGDGIPDVRDKCMLDSRNAAAPCDTDQDGYGNVCDADFDQSGTVGANDFTMFFVPDFQTGIPGPHGTDMNCDGRVDAADFSKYFVPRFKAGGGPGPSGLACAGTIPCN